MFNQTQYTCSLFCFSMEKEYKCDSCNSRYTHKKDLKAHFAAVHENKEYTCEKCDKVFKYEKNLRRHVETDHDMKRFYCPLC